jgi:hypothetical protein
MQSLYLFQTATKLNGTFVNNGTFRAAFTAGYYWEQYKAEAYK